MKTKFFGSLLALGIGMVILGLFESCSPLVKGMVRRNLTVEKGSMPPEFGRDTNEVLICLLPDDNKGAGRRIKRKFTKHYKGKVLFLTDSEFEKTKENYAIEVYHYVLTFSGKAYVIHYSDGSTMPAGTFYYHIYDRDLQRNHTLNFTSGMYKAIFSAYGKALEKKRLSWESL